MNIAMIGQKGYPAHYGGVERHVAEISERLVRDGYNVTIYNRAWYGGDMNGTDSSTGVRVKTVATIRTKHLDAIVHAWLSTFHAIYKKADVIHYHGVGPSLMSWIPRIFSHARVITTFHCIDRHHQKWNWFARFMLRMGEKSACFFAHETITVSRTLTTYCEREYRRETTYIPNGVSVRAENMSSNELLSPFGLTQGSYVLMVSRLVPHKGAHILIEAFQKLKQESLLNEYMNNLKLVIVGGSAFTDDYVRSLHTLAAPSNDIVFTDYQSGDTLESLFRGASFVVHPSMSEGLPITVLEAMSYGKPTLVSTIPEHLEVVKDVRMTFIENDITALYKRMKGLISMSNEEKQRIGDANKRYVGATYNWDDIVTDIISIYQQKQKVHKERTQPILA
ncbi:MAG: hypothetical protein COU32_01045 [Candidatus Magasanikbacteria bacterium CG10_big_fil_rev_8_21_14_0_10_42_10]|uniref:Glycosyl transferase family 1 n=2 Tax=Candidatus Magasanikiibacteriota TaxID=1752731 RepID=A0A2H0TZ16_9BACT|nr:MAG: hypothetical protein COU32_01045 [Candidatus Magasanikbacteria bacterium CG10_big_fil_rev_8_21_14_0_10_42_10]PIZ93070.1 MAG: hypothetical protein COX82_03435 [Candidatus Magasanikbacteria bacterium CG_4_10_14_0_2_um_filter_41_10]